MTRPLLLDLFCSAGGAAMGYHRAGFDVIGVDIKPQKNYPFEFVEHDALELMSDLLKERSTVMYHRGYLLESFSAIHASPPCQAYSVMKNRVAPRKTVDLVAATRILLQKSGKPWVIENVPGSPLLSPIVLCGTHFGLKVLRHRLFETWPRINPPEQSCKHPPRGSVGKAGHYGDKKPGDWVSVAGRGSRIIGSAAMGIDWYMNRDEVSQAIPPYYTEWIGKRLLEVIQ